MAQMGQHWDIAPLPKGWDQGIEEFSVALAGIDMSETMPIPQISGVARANRIARGQHPLQPLLRNMHSIPYEWYGREGSVTPVLGEKITFCLGRSGRDWLAASQQSLMAQIRNENTTEYESVIADAVVTLSWEKAATAAESIILRAAELSLLPEMNSNDVRHYIAPKIKAMQAMGEMKVAGHFEGNNMVFKGNLARDTGQ